ncbi:FliI/YscN family ATPase [Erythrobacteraceae bacterium CFH 75059]|uniref:FliI/YscN family ATPase n=1 Tax=Qipengyuania thermophila TaxID=2509361 RepID=UPI0010220087|nr:FliI/YscN family ATPase [Qipengyuania thermophila]TCD06307.1 FliI/YscN family ATPase [Erythrobacteraceae bacterium CFH 75059]
MLTLCDAALAAPVPLARHAVFRRSGVLTAFEGGIATIAGLPVPVGAVCSIETGPDAATPAEVIGFRGDAVVATVLGAADRLTPGSRVTSSGSAGKVAVGDAFLGRAVDALGRPIDGGPPPRAESLRPLLGEAGGALRRMSVTEPFDCGVRAINALATMGVGQRLGIVAGSGVGKSTLMDMMAGGASCDAVVVALIGERAREVADFVNRHMRGGARRRIAMIAVPADEAAGLRLRGARFATALAEHLRAQGASVLLIMDSLTRVAHAARQVGLALGEPPAARGYPPQAMAAITSLVERAGRCASSGGSITGLYTVLADGDDQDDPVVDTARAILDGQIVLSRALAQRGQFPAIDVCASLSRVASQVTDPHHQAAAARFRRLASDAAAAHELLLLGAYRQGADAAYDEALRLRAQFDAFVSQGVGERFTLAQSRMALETVLAD